ncbi:MAG: ATP-binding cassette domain-containing protein [Bacteroidales bacterium]|nr:ATP-binding cassette domain-containing protein [Bacteroidales bacterium]
MSMTESILKALMRLYAIVTQIHPESKLTQCRAIVEAYLREQVSPFKVNQYLIMYDFYHSSLREREVLTGEKQFSLFSVKAIIICESINKVLDRKQKLLVLVQLLEILKLKEIEVKEDSEFLRAISHALKCDEAVFDSCKAFVFNALYEVPDKENLLIIDDGNELEVPGARHLFREYFKGKLVIFQVECAHTYLFRNIDADDRLFYKGQALIPDRTYSLEKGSFLRSPLTGTIYYSDVVKEFMKTRTSFKLNYAAEKIEFRFPNSNNGIQPFTLYEESGVMIGIMGGSGVGKSTLLNLLNGNLKPRKGRVLINGYDIHLQKKEVEGIIGYIPQDDLLIEELTVEQNLLFNAKLCFKDLKPEEIHRRVKKILIDLDLYEVRHLKVGNPLKKYISGGQRKRLNIALELIREPYILFIDEPTSGLSSADSETVIDLLREQSLKGKLVIVNIHQPSSTIYKRFDRLVVMDKGGRVVFHGNPLDALLYFKTENQLINAEEGECPNCGNVNPEHLLQILEAKKVNEDGDYISERQVTPEEWYQRYTKKYEPEINLGAEIRSDLPSNDFRIPGKFKQFRIFTLRNVFSKISDLQYLLINLLEAPLLAFILGWFTKYNAGTPTDLHAYIFSQNVNLPVYIFMAGIVALFLGLMVSAEEIIRDRKILERESFLNLSRFSYYNSKLLFLFFLSAIQTALFVWIGNSILEIRGMFLYYWVMLLSVALVANIIGLNISSAMKTVVSIYILIPLLLVPQIILGGAMISFDKLNSKLTHPEYVPIVGDLMVSRWSYEALAVTQFRRNAYQKNFFDEERQISDLANETSLLPILVDKLNAIERDIKSNRNYANVDQNLKTLQYEIWRLGLQFKWADTEFAGHMSQIEFNTSVSTSTRKFIAQVKDTLNQKLNVVIGIKDRKIAEIQKKLGSTAALNKLRKDHHNESLAEILLRKREIEDIIEVEGRLIRVNEPIYKSPRMIYGRAHLFSPEKRILSLNIDTYWFNLAVVLLMGFLFYVMLLMEILKKLLTFVTSFDVRYIVDQWKLHLLNALKPIIRNK